MKILVIFVQLKTWWECGWYHDGWPNVNLIHLTSNRFQSGARLASGCDATEQSAPIMRFSISLLLVTCCMNLCTAGVLLHCSSGNTIYVRLMSWLLWHGKLNWMYCIYVHMYIMTAAYCVGCRLYTVLQKDHWEFTLCSMLCIVCRCTALVCIATTVHCTPN